MVQRLIIDFCGEIFEPKPGTEFVIGREGDLIVDDDNPFLHRRFLVVVCAEDGMWWIANVGERLSATLSDVSNTMRATLAPGARIPLTNPATTLVFSAGPTTYEVDFEVSNLEVPEVAADSAESDATATMGAVVLTETQKLLIVALAEPLLRRQGEALSAIPSSADAAARLGWPITTFNRKLDNVCDKFDRIGVRGLRGGPGKLASNRKARLVEYALDTRIVSSADLELLHNLPSR